MAGGHVGRRRTGRGAVPASLLGAGDVLEGG